MSVGTNDEKRTNANAANSQPAYCKTDVSGSQSLECFLKEFEEFTLSLNKQIESFVNKHFKDTKGIRVLSGRNGRYLGFAIDVDCLKSRD